MKTAKKEAKVTKPAKVENVEVKPAEAKVLPIVAVVKNGKYEVRRYTLEEHGKAFAELAREFAAKKDYQVELA